MSLTNISLDLVSSSETAKLLTGIQLCYGAPCFLLMIAFNVFLGTHRNYRHSFYRIVQMDLTVNTLCWLNTWPALRLEYHSIGVWILRGMETVFPGYISAAKFLTNFFLHMQFCSAVTLNIHRITSVVHPTKHDHLWKRWYPYYYMMIFILCFLPPLIPFRGLSFTVSFVDDQLIRFKNPAAISLNSTKIGVYSTIYFCVLSTVGIITATLVSKKIKDTSAASVSDRGIGKKLTRISLVYTSVYSGILLWSDLSALNSWFNFIPDTFMQFAVQTMTFASDLMTLSLPFILMLFDTNIRKDILRRGKSPMTTITKVTATVSHF